jgi:hypothetical protein
MSQPPSRHGFCSTCATAGRNALADPLVWPVGETARVDVGAEEVERWV